MRGKICFALLISLLLSLLFMPLAVSADDGKSIIKGMVQAPAEYSVGNCLNCLIYGIWELDRYWLIPGYGNIVDRMWVYPSWVFYRILPIG